MDLPPVSQVIAAIRTFGAPELQQVLDGLCPCFELVPLDSLLKFAEDVAQAIEAKTELEQMRAAVKSSDQTLDVAEAEILQAGK